MRTGNRSPNPSSLRSRVGKTVAPSTIYRALKRHGWRKVVPRSQHPKTVPEKLEKTQKKLRREAIAHGQQTQQSLAVNQPIRLMFTDEARFGRISEIRACWAPHEMCSRVFSQFVRTSLYVCAGIIPKTGHLDAFILPTVNLDSRSIFLQEVSLQHPHEHPVIIFRASRLAHLSSVETSAEPHSSFPPSR